MRRLLTSTELCIIFTSCPASFAQAGSERITAAPEMQKLLNAMTGSWSMSLNYAPSETRSSGGTGTGHVVFRPGPGGLSLIEDEYSKDSTGEHFGLSVTWWDEAAKGFHALWCDNHLPTGCIMMSKLLVPLSTGNSHLLDDSGIYCHHLRALVASGGMV